MQKLRPSTALLRVLLVLTLATGLLIPRMGAVLAEAAGFERAVICVGDTLVTVTLGADGAPVDIVEGDVHPCLAAVPAALPDAPDGAPISVAFRHSSVPFPDSTPLRAALWDGPPPMRAPPARA
jgi:hypothetical protein